MATASPSPLLVLPLLAGVALLGVAAVVASRRERRRHTARTWSEARLAPVFDSVIAAVLILPVVFAGARAVGAGPIWSPAALALAVAVMAGVLFRGRGGGDQVTRVELDGDVLHLRVLAQELDVAVAAVEDVEELSGGGFVVRLADGRAFAVPPEARPVIEVIAHRAGTPLPPPAVPPD